MNGVGNAGALRLTLSSARHRLKLNERLTVEPASDSQANCTVQRPRGQVHVFGRRLMGGVPLDGRKMDQTPTL